MINPAFSQLVLNSFQGTFNRQARSLVNKFSKHVGTGSFDASTYISDNALETICESAIGIPANGEKVVDVKYEEASNRMLGIAAIRFLTVWMHWDFLFNWTKLKKVQDEVVRILHETSTQVIQKRKAEFKYNKKNCDDIGIQELKVKPFLQLLFELRDTKGALDDVEVREEVSTMILAGHDTCSLVLLYTLVMLGSYPHIQDRSFQELKMIFGDSERDVEKNDLSKLIYLEAVINETIRLYPIGPILARDVEKTVKLRNYTIPGGSTCLVFYWSLHRNPTLWGFDSQEFNPDRWLDPDNLPKHPAAFGGFSYGKRMCPGKSYAMMSLKTSLSHLLRKYRVTGDQSKLKFKLDVMLKPVDGHHINLELR